MPTFFIPRVTTYMESPRKSSHFLTDSGFSSGGAPAMLLSSYVVSSMSVAS